MSWVIGIVPVLMLQTPRVSVQGFFGKPGNGHCVLLVVGAGSGFIQVCVNQCVVRLEEETKLQAYLDAGLGRGFPSGVRQLFLKEKEERAGEMATKNESEKQNKARAS